MLISILLTLTPETPATLPPDLGRAVQAETLARLGQVDPALAEAIHASDGPKPLTCSGLVAAESEPEPRHPGRQRDRPTRRALLRARDRPGRAGEPGVVRRVGRAAAGALDAARAAVPRAGGGL